MKKEEAIENEELVRVDKECCTFCPYCLIDEEGNMYCWEQQKINCEDTFAEQEN